MVDTFWFAGLSFLTARSFANTCAIGGQFVIQPRQLFSRKRIILKCYVINICNKRRATKAPVELWVKRVFRRVLKTVLFWGNLRWKFPSLPFRLCEAQAFLINKCFKLNYEVTIEKKKFLNLIARNGDIQRTEMKRPTFFGRFRTTRVMSSKSKQRATCYTSNEKSIFYLSKELLFPWMHNYAVRQVKNQFRPETK